MTNFVISADGERYHETDATAREAAAAQARLELAHDAEPTDEVTVYVGMKREASTFLGATAKFRLGDQVTEWLDEWLADCIGGEDELVELSRDDKQALGEMIVKFVAERDGFRAYGVGNVTEHTLSEPSAGEEKAA